MRWLPQHKQQHRHSRVHLHGQPHAPRPPRSPPYSRNAPPMVGRTSSSSRARGADGRLARMSTSLAALLLGRGALYAPLWKSFRLTWV